MNSICPRRGTSTIPLSSPSELMSADSWCHCHCCDWQVNQGCISHRGSCLQQLCGAWGWAQLATVTALCYPCKLTAIMAMKQEGDGIGKTIFSPLRQLNSNSFVRDGFFSNEKKIKWMCLTKNMDIITIFTSSKLTTAYTHQGWLV